MKVVSFELTMPNVGSWNGKWTGADKKYFIVKKLTNKVLDREHFSKLNSMNRDSWYYNFGDGWGANIWAEIIDGKQARKRRKISAGFCGYDWMVESIIENGKIK